MLICLQYQPRILETKGGVARDEPMCHANEHDVRVRFLPVLFVLRRLIVKLLQSPPRKLRDAGFFLKAIAERCAKDV